MIVISHFVNIYDIMTIVPLIIFEGSMTESTFHLAIEFDGVLGLHDETLVVVAIVLRVHLEMDRTANELLHTVQAMDDAITFVEGGEVTCNLISHSTLSMLFVEVTLVCLRCTCFFGLEKGFEVSLYDEGCPCAIAKIAERE